MLVLFINKSTWVVSSVQYSEGKNYKKYWFCCCTFHFLLKWKVVLLWDEKIKVEDASILQRVVLWPAIFIVNVLDKAELLIFSQVWEKLLNYIWPVYMCCVAELELIILICCSLLRTRNISNQYENAHQVGTVGMAAGIDWMLTFTKMTLMKISIVLSV